MNETMTDGLMTLAEIEERFENEWILLEDPEYDAHDILIRGKVLWHSKNRQEVYRRDLELHPRSAAYLYTGPTPENIAINL